jgi:hypothetical protein
MLYGYKGALPNPLNKTLLTNFNPRPPKLFVQFSRIDSIEYYFIEKSHDNFSPAFFSDIFFPGM